MNDIHYIFPRFKNMSFSLIARAQIREIRDRVKIYETDEEVLDNLLWVHPKTILLHPILYVTIGDKPEYFNARRKRLEKLLRIKRILGGFETTDSDRISRVAVDVLNKLDLTFVPSQFCIDTMKRSGVESPLVLLPHGIGESFCSEDRSITSKRIQQLRDLKTKKNATLVLYFCMHSDYRKGSDIVYDAMKFLQGKHENLVLVFKSSKHHTPDQHKLRLLRTIEITSWMDDLELRQLYDICDVVIAPSRGGGFELNALEALSRGIPTLVPNAGCFLDYIDYAVPLEISGSPMVFPDNPIHAGKGWEVSPDTLSFSLDQVISNLDEHKARTLERSNEIHERFSWRKIGKDLYSHLERGGFCQTI